MTATSAWQKRLQWPVYAICTGASQGLPLLLEDLLVITADLEFARCICRHISGSASIIRITNYNRWVHVDASAIAAVRDLNKLWPQSPTVLEEVSCKLCICFLGSTSWTRGDVVGINSAWQEPCHAHRSTWQPQFSHETLRLNTVSAFRSHSTWSTDQSSIAAAKLDWVGQLYFTRAFRSSLPNAVIELIHDALLGQRKDQL